MYVLPHRPNERTGIAVVTSLLAGLLLGGGGLVLYGPKLGGGSCAHRQRLTVVADATIAQGVKDVAARLGGCAEVRVTAEDSAKTASVEPSSDVWIPDSSLWLDLAHRTVNGQAGSLASSPLVFVLSAEAARRHGPLLREQSWSVFKTDDVGFGLHLMDPATSASGIASLLLLRQAAGSGGKGLRAFATSVRSARTVLASDGAAEKAALTGADDRAQVLVESEQRAWQQISATPSTFAVVYPAAGTATLDYPYAVLTTDPDLQQLAARLSRSLRAPPGQAAMRKIGLRSPDGSPDPELVRGGLSESPLLLPIAQPGSAASILQIWRRMHQDIRGVILVDESGSSEGLVLKMHGMLRRSITAMPDGTEFGLWAMGSGRSYDPLVSLGPLGETTSEGNRRTDLVTQLDQPLGGPEKSTRRYDAILAAFDRVTQGYDPDKENIVLLLTTSHSRDASRIGLDALVNRLRGKFHADRPVTLVVIGVGEHLDLDPLRRLTAVTQGGVYHLRDLGGLTALFQSSVALLACDGPQCPR